jgi:hypothetical protein
MLRRANLQGPTQSKGRGSQHLMNRRLLLLIAIIAFAAPSLAPLAQQQTATGVVRGIVVREGTNEPIRDVQITVGRLSDSAQELRTLAQEARQRGADSVANLLEQTLLQTFGPGVRGGTPQYNGLTDSNGRFIIEGIPAGEYPLNAQREGYFGTTGQPQAPFVRRTVTVVPQQTTEVALTLIPGAAVSGRVLDPSGTPTVGIQVEIFRRTYTNGAATLQLVAQKPADDRGEYRHFQLPPGEYFLAAGLRQAARGLAARGAPVLSAEAQARTFYPSATDLAAALTVTLRPGDDLTGIDILLRRAIGSKISGRVVSQLPAAAAVASFATLTLLPRDRNLPADPRFSGGLRVEMAIPGNGTFEILNVPPGAYDLYASLPDPTGWGPMQPPGSAQQPLAYGRTSIDVRGGDVDGVLVSVHSGVDVKGRVLVNGTTANVLDAVTLSLQPLDSSAGIAVYSEVGRFQPLISPDGSFTFPAVPEAKYRLHAEIATIFRAADVGVVPTAQPATTVTPALQGEASPMAPRNTYVEDVRLGGSSIYNDGIDIGTSVPGSIEILINTNGGEIRGTVVLTGQQPVPAGTTVVLVPALNRRQNPALYKTASTSTQGTFSIRAIPPGIYKLFAFERIPAGAHLNTDFMKAYEDRGVSITVSAGAVLSQAVTLIPAEK